MSGPPGPPPRHPRARPGALDFWAPRVAEILAAHGLAPAGREPRAGFNPTFPTFVCGDVVVKLFGGAPAWRASHAAERSALARVARDPAIAAPRLPMDVFQPVAAKLPLDAMATLDELAEALFGV